MKLERHTVFVKMRSLRFNRLLVAFGIAVLLSVFFFGRQRDSIKELREAQAKVCLEPRQEHRAVATESENKLVEIARSMYAKRGVVAFAVINNAYLPMALSWSCNTAGMAGVHESVLFLTTDTPSALRLRALFPALTVFSLDTSDYDGDQDYDHKGYVRLTVQRTRLVLRLLEAGIRLLLFEVDCLWLSDPVPALLARRDDADIFATLIGGDPVNLTASGFLLLNPRAATISLWWCLERQMDHLYRRQLAHTRDFAKITGFGDQESLVPLVSQRYAGVEVLHLPLDLYPDGKWYLSHTPGQPLPDPRPVIINNNWVVGRRTKTDRAKAYEHWFWDDTAGKCNATAVHNLFP